MTHTKQKIRFIMLLARALHMYGASADRIETALYVLSQKLNIRADYFSLPTSLIANFKVGDNSDIEDEFTRMLRLEPGDINLEKLYFADKTVDDVVDGIISIDEGIHYLNHLIERPSLHSSRVFNLSLVCLTTSACIVLGGSWIDAAFSGFAGLMIALFRSEIKGERIDTIAEAIFAFVTAFLAFYCLKYIPELHPEVIILSVLLYFVPGLSLTTGIGEIASQNLTSGTARLMGAIVILLKLCFGVYLGSVMAKNFVDTGHVASHPIEHASLVIFLAVFVLSFSFTIVFQARWRDSLWVLFAGLSSFFVQKVLVSLLGKIAATLVTGTYIGAGANLYARLCKKPSMIFSLPAIILLVPGSVGYKSLDLFFGQNTIMAVNTMFQTLVLCIALVAGTYFGNLIIGPKRSL